MKRDSKIIALYEQGLSVPKIAKQVGLGRTRVYTILDENGIKRRSNKDYAPQSGGREKEIIEYYGLGYSAANTGKEFGVCEATVLYVLRKNNVAVRKPGNVGEKSSNWKGGISKDKDYMRVKKNDYRNKRKSYDPLYKLTQAMRARMSSFFRRSELGKSGKIRKRKATIEMLGADFKTVFKHIESQFTDGMSWDKYGQFGFHIDHIIPLCSARNEEELLKLMHYTNLRPLWAKDNHKKGGRCGI